MKYSIKEAQQTLHTEAQAILDFASRLNDDFLKVANLLLKCKGHVLVAGAGTSNTVAHRFAHLLSCCGISALPISAADALHGGSGAITKNDVVYIISKGGQSSEINEFANISKKRGAKIIAHTEKPESPLAKMSDAIYYVKANGEIDPFGKIATGSSLVNAAACDALCVALLKLSGYSEKEFNLTHPQGAVGKMILNEKK